MISCRRREFPAALTVKYPIGIDSPDKRATFIKLFLWNNSAPAPAQQPPNSGTRKRSKRGCGWWSALSSLASVTFCKGIAIPFLRGHLHGASDGLVEFAGDGTAVRQGRRHCHNPVAGHRSFKGRFVNAILAQCRLRQHRFHAGVGHIAANFDCCAVNGTAVSICHHNEQCGHTNGRCLRFYGQRHSHTWRFIGWLHRAAAASQKKAKKN